MDLFRNDNSIGYTGIEIMALNEEWMKIVEKMGLEEYTEEYDIEAKRFSDEVAGR